MGRFIDRLSRIGFVVVVAALLIAASIENGLEVGVSKIDNQKCDGLLGTSNSLCYRTHEIEKHFHSRERWLSISADQSGTDWNESVSDSGVPDVFTAISGNDDYGSDANDEAKVIGTGDTCGTGLTTYTKFDLHEIIVEDASATSTYVLRIVYGTGTMADAISAGQYTETMFKRDTGAGEAHGTPLPFNMPRGTWGTTKIWIQAKNTTDNADVDFYVGIHCYAG